MHIIILYKLLISPYSVVFVQLATVGGDGVEQTLVDDALGNLLPNHLPQDGRKLFITDGNIYKITVRLGLTSLKLNVLFQQ